MKMDRRILIACMLIMLSGVAFGMHIEEKLKKLTVRSSSRQRDTNQMPVFINTPYTATISVNQQVNDPVLTVTATDGDLASEIRYDIKYISPAENNYFSLNELTGQITLYRRFSKAQNTYTMTVEAFNKDFPRMRASANVLIYVVRTPARKLSAKKKTIDWFGKLKNYLQPWHSVQ